MCFSCDQKPASLSGRVEVAIADAEEVSWVPWASDKPSGGRQKAVCGAQRLWLGRHCVSQVPSKDVVVPGTAVQDLLKIQIQSLPGRYPPPPPTPQDTTKIERKQTEEWALIYMGDSQQPWVAWEPRKQWEGQNPCGIWSWCLLLSSSRPLAYFLWRITWTRNWRVTLGICCFLWFRYTPFSPLTRNSRDNREATVRPVFCIRGASVRCSLLSPPLPPYI